MDERMQLTQKVMEIHRVIVRNPGAFGQVTSWDRERMFREIMEVHRVVTGQLLAQEARTWQPGLPPLPDPPPIPPGSHPQRRVASWLIRWPARNLPWATWLLWFFDGHFYVSAEYLGQSGIIEMVPIQKMQVRTVDGETRAFGKAEDGTWSVPVEGLENAGLAPYPLE